MHVVLGRGRPLRDPPMYSRRGRLVRPRAGLRIQPRTKCTNNSTGGGEARAVRLPRGCPVAAAGGSLFKIFKVCPACSKSHKHVPSWVVVVVLGPLPLRSKLAGDARPL